MPGFANVRDKSHRQGEQGEQPVENRPANQKPSTVQVVMSVTGKRGALLACMK